MTTLDSQTQKTQQYFTYLKELYTSQGLTDMFLTHINSLHSNNYSYSEIATPLNISRTTVSKWVKKEHVYTPDPDQPPSPDARPLPYNLSPLEQANLRALAQKASKVSKNTPLDSPNRKAAEQLLNSIIYYQEKNTSISQIAKAANVSRRSIYQRLEAHDSTTTNN